MVPNDERKDDMTPIYDTLRAETLEQGTNVEEIMQRKPWSIEEADVRIAQANVKPLKKTAKKARNGSR